MNRRASAVRALRGAPARFVLLLALLMLPWPPYAHVYAGFVSALGELTIGRAAAPVTFRFGPAPAGAAAAPANPWQLRVRADDPASGRFVETAVDLRRAGYLASAVFLALALATPLPWSRRLWLLARGLALLQLVPLLALLSFFSGRLPVQAFVLPPLARWSIEIAYRSLVAAPGMAFAVPLLLWLGLGGWRWERFGAARNEESSHQPAASG